MSLEQQETIVAGWRETGRLLEARWRTELESQTPEQSQQAALDMLQPGEASTTSDDCMYSASGARH